MDSVDRIGNIIQDENEELKNDIKLLKDQILKMEEKLLRNDDLISSLIKLHS